MVELPKTLNDPSLWVSVVAALVACVAAGISWWNALATRKSLALAEYQEQRRRPKLVLYLADGYCKFKVESRLLAFSISISNPTDSDNSIAHIELQVNYTTSRDAYMAMKIPSNAEFAGEFGQRELTILPAPTRIDAHQTIAGWVFFEIREALLVDCRVDNYFLLFRDSHGLLTKLEHTMIREFVDEEAEGSD